MLHGDGNMAEGYLTVSTVSLLLITIFTFNTIYGYKDRRHSFVLVVTPQQMDYGFWQLIVKWICLFLEVSEKSITTDNW